MIYLIREGREKRGAHRATFEPLFRKEKGGKDTLGVGKGAAGTDLTDPKLTLRRRGKGKKKGKKECSRRGKRKGKTDHGYSKFGMRNKQQQRSDYVKEKEEGGGKRGGSGPLASCPIIQSQKGEGR